MLEDGLSGGIFDEGLGGGGMEEDEAPEVLPVVETDGRDGAPEVPSEDVWSDDWDIGEVQKVDA